MNSIKLFTPGPTPVPERVRRAGAAPMIHHRSEEFARIMEQVRAKLKSLCGTDGEVVLFSSSGTGGLEAVVASLFHAQDDVVIVEAGKFGQRWEKLAEQYQLFARTIHVPWGKSVEAQEVLRTITPSTKAVLIQANESSTGAFHPIYDIAKGLEKFPDVLFVVDAITAMGIHDIHMKRDGIDVMICASQKALMCPPGLATVALAPKALERVRKEAASFYFSIHRELTAQRKNSSAFTPAISLCVQLLEALNMIEEEGHAQLFKRHTLMQKMAREAFTALGLSLFNRDQDASAGITVVLPPPGLDVKTWIKQLKKSDGLWLAGGQDELDGKIFRIAHMGAIQPQDLIEAIEIIEKSWYDILSAAKDHVGSKRAKQILVETA